MNSLKYFPKTTLKFPLDLQQQRMFGFAFRTKPNADLVATLSKPQKKTMNRKEIYQIQNETMFIENIRRE